MAVKDYENASRVLSFCENIISEIMGTDNLDYGICMLYQGMMPYQKMDFSSAEAPPLRSSYHFRKDATKKRKSLPSPICQPFDDVSIQHIIIYCTKEELLLPLTCHG